MTLSAPSSGATIADRTGTGTIVDNDAVSAPGGPAVPFGSHLNPYAAGTILPMGSQATIDAAVVSLYNKWKSFVVSAGGYGLAVKSTDADYPYVAEAQGYGLELTALMAGADPAAQATFDGILKYVLAHPSSINSRIACGRTGLILRPPSMERTPQPTATWPSLTDFCSPTNSGQLRDHNYKPIGSRADQRDQGRRNGPQHEAADLGRLEQPRRLAVQLNSPIRFHDRPLPGIRGCHQRPVLGPGGHRHQNLLTQQQTTYCPEHGSRRRLRGEHEHNSQTAPANFLEGKTDGQYSYNAVRVPWHIGADAVVYGDATSAAQAQKITAWFRSKTGDDPSKIVSGYKLDERRR